MTGRLFADFLTNDSRQIHKWVHYFPIYERHFEAWVGKAVTFIEIGVDQGGSLQMWQRYFGPYAKIIGIDINPACKAFESPGIFVRIGDQSDHGFLRSILDEFGAPDVVLDDGSHQMVHVSATFDLLYPPMPKNGVYMVEDMHTAYWPEFGGSLGGDTFIERSKRMVDKLNADFTRGGVEPDTFTKQTRSICFYDSVVVIEKGDVWRKDAPATKGTEGEFHRGLVR